MSQKGVGVEEGVDIEAEPRERREVQSQEGWAVRTVGEGKTWEKLATAIVRISEGEQWLYRVGREHNSQKVCTRVK